MSEPCPTQDGWPCGTRFRALTSPRHGCVVRRFVCFLTRSGSIHFVCVCFARSNLVGLREQLRALEMQRHSPVLLMLFDSATEAMLASSPSASEFYSRYSADDRAKFEKSHVPGDERWTFKKQTLSSILRFSMLEAPQSDDVRVQA